MSKFLFFAAILALNFVVAIFLVTNRPFSRKNLPPPYAGFPTTILRGYDDLLFNMLPRDAAWKRSLAMEGLGGLSQCKIEGALYTLGSDGSLDKRPFEGFPYGVPVMCQTRKCSIRCDGASGAIRIAGFEDSVIRISRRVAEPTLIEVFTGSISMDATGEPAIFDFTDSWGTARIHLDRASRVNIARRINAAQNAPLAITPNTRGVKIAIYPKDNIYLPDRPVLTVSALFAEAEVAWLDEAPKKSKKGFNLSLAGIQELTH